MSVTDNDPVFKGVHTLLSVIAELCRRPGFWQRSRYDEDRGETPLPLVCLVREQASSDFLRSVSSRLTGAAIPHVLIDAAHAEEGVRRRFHPGQMPGDAEVPLLPLLDEVRHALGQRTYDRARLSRFDRYRLADWLTRQYLPPPSRRDDGSGIMWLLRSWISKGRVQPDVPFEVDPGRVTLWIWLLLRVGPALTFWLWTRGPESRWFMNQDYLTAHTPDFLSFAQRLTRGHRESGSDEEVKKLLVHAFLEDLRVAYRRRLLPFRPKIWRRTAHTVVLLDNVAEDNGGWELLRLINAVRNETGDPDPLLLIAAGDPPREDSDEAELIVARPDRAADALNEWRWDLPRRRQRKERLARYLSVSLPAAVTGVSVRKLSSDDEYAWRRVRFTPDPPALMAHRHVTAVLVVALLAGTGGLGATAAIPRFDSGCFPFGAGGFHVPTPWDIRGIHVRPRRASDGRKWECIGYSDNESQVFGSDSGLRAVQREIFRQNARARDMHEDSERPLVSVVYFAALSSVEADPTKEASLAEELKGLLLQQVQLNHLRRTKEPLLRVIIANAGDSMARAVTVTKDMLLPLFEDESALGVIGMNRTNGHTKEAIRLLGDKGIPVLATTLTDAKLVKLSPLYFQLAPGHDKQADLVWGYVEQQGAQTLIIYQQEYADGYVKELVDALIDKKPSRMESPTVVPWSKATDIPSGCYESSKKNIGFYAGLGDDFKAFLDSLQDTCEVSSKLPKIVGSDATARLFTSSETRESIPYGLTVLYVSLGAPAALAGPDCIHEGKLPDNLKNFTSLGDFCQEYHKLPKRLSIFRGLPGMERPTERMAVAYDAVGLFREAVSNNQGIVRDNDPYVPNRSAIAAELREINYTGVTGNFNFGDGDGSTDDSNSYDRVANGRLIAILEFLDPDKPLDVPKCRFSIGLPKGEEITCEDST